jgi:hypothetical protein
MSGGQDQHTAAAAAQLQLRRIAALGHPERRATPPHVAASAQPLPGGEWAVWQPLQGLGLGGERGAGTGARGDVAELPADTAVARPQLSRLVLDGVATRNECRRVIGAIRSVFGGEPGPSREFPPLIAAAEDVLGESGAVWRSSRVYRTAVASLGWLATFRMLDSAVTLSGGLHHLLQRTLWCRL